MGTRPINGSLTRRDDRTKWGLTYDGGSLVLIELLLQMSDAERHAEKADRIASPG